jgi:hypothetical protein
VNLSSLRRTCGLAAVVVCATATPAVAVDHDEHFPPVSSAATGATHDEHFPPVSSAVTGATHDEHFPPVAANRTGAVHDEHFPPVSTSVAVADDGDLERSSAAVLAAGAAVTGLAAGAALTLAATRRRGSLALR